MRSLAATALLSACLATFACSPPTDQPSVTETSTGQVTGAVSGKAAAVENNGLVRFINANPDELSASLNVGDDRLFSSVAFKGVTAYMQISRGHTQFKLRSGDSGEDIAATRRELFPGRHYSIIALPNRAGKARLVTLSDNLGATDPAEARIRLINATHDVADVDLYLSGTNVRVVRGVDPGEFTTFTDLVPGAVELRSGMQAPPMHLSMLPILAGRVYTFIVVGKAGSFDVVQVEDRVEP